MGLQKLLGEGIKVKMRKNFGQYLWFVWQYRGKFLLFVGVLLLSNLAKGVQPYFFKLFVDAVPDRNLSVLLTILGVYLAIRLVQVLFDILQYITGDMVLLPMARDVRLKVFEKVQDLDFAYHLNKSTGSLISAFKRGDNAVFSLFHVVFQDLASIFLQFLIMMFFFWQVGNQYVLLLVLLVAINLFFAKLLVNKNVKTLRDFNAEEDKISAIITDNLINFETVKLFAKESFERNKLQKAFVPWLKKLWAFALTFRVIDLAIGGAGNLGFGLILWLALKQYVAGIISAGDFIMLLGFLVEFYGRLYDLIFRLRDLVKEQVDLEKYFAVLPMKTQVKDPAKPKELKSAKGEILFDKINFSYGEGKGSALSDISIRIRQGQTVALVGHSGAGKSTVVKLMLRLFDPKSGTISIDGMPIKQMTKSYLRSMIGVVPQEPILFNNTVGYNIRYGRGQVSEQELHAAAKMAHAHDFITALPKGYDSLVGERGIKLSGGQKQRLAIARMILSNPSIVIFDEATSQLDSESEQKIQDAFWRVTADKTTIIVAHRLSTVVKADKIIVMEDGKIVEVGSHQELVVKDGLYANFWRLQTLG